MSSMQRSSPAIPSLTSTTESSTSKKKFGKNLNKLTKPPAPPIPTAGTSRQNSSSRNGLLLLSTKRSSSSTSTPLASGGLLASKSSSQSNITTSKWNADGSKSANDALLSAAMGRGDSSQNAAQQPDAWGVAEKQQEAQPSLAPNGGVSSGHQVPFIEEPRLIRDSEKSPDSPRKLPEGDEQVAYMSRLARERSERRRMEEEERSREQKERAARRLRELEGRRTSETKVPTRNPVPDVASIHTLPKAPVVLERLGRPKSARESESDGGNRIPVSGALSGERGPARTLFDPNNPNRTYSSLVGGVATHRDDHMSERGPGPDGSDRPHGRNRAASMENAEQAPSGPMIHLSSYEDRDRGERNNSAGPRMLFDPKSGSMVAVSSRDEGASRGGKKERKAKGRHRDEYLNGRNDVKRNDAGENDVALLKPSRKKKDRREDVSSMRKDRRRGDSLDVSPKEESKMPRSRLRAGRPLADSKRLPRTRGVLYDRDEKGNCVCVDGCEGDQGYGSHGVPGGRIRNPDAYDKFMEEQRQLGRGNREPFERSRAERYPTDSYLSDGKQYDEAGHHSDYSSPAQLPNQKVDWVKPNEKIELVTGVDDSPTLQATANPWAPSEAALKAAAVAKEQAEANMDLSSHILESEDGDSRNEAPSFSGLGFDPTENMDSVMRSPSLHADLTKKLDVDLTALALDTDGETGNRNIFAFGSSTWGTSETGRLSKWTGLGNNDSSDYGDAKAQNGNDNDNTSGGTSSFLSLSGLAVEQQDASTWGTTGLGGLGGSALPSDGGE